MNRSRFSGEPRSTYTDWTREALNATRKAPAWHKVGEGQRLFNRTMASQIRLGRVKALDPKRWEVRYTPTDDPQRVVLFIRDTSKDSAP